MVPTPRGRSKATTMATATDTNTLSPFHPRLRDTTTVTLMTMGVRRKKRSLELKSCVKFPLLMMSLAVPHLAPSAAVSKITTAVYFSVLYHVYFWYCSYFLVCG